MKNQNELKVIALYLSNYTAQFYLREISKFTKIPLKTTQNTVAILEKNKILKSNVRGKNKYFNLNLDNIQTKFYLLQSEIYKTTLFMNKFPQFKIFLKELKTNSLLVAFGSFAKYVSINSSDLDLLIISNKKQEKLPVYLLPCKVHKVKISNNTFLKALEKQENLIKEIEENHVILNNHSFYIDVMWRYYEK
jgi:DNA polymerase sigma